MKKSCPLACFLLIVISASAFGQWFDWLPWVGSGKSKDAPLQQEPIREGETFDAEHSMEKLLKMAEDGSPNAQVTLGKVYLSGTDEEQPDPQKAIGWFKKAAEAGHPEGQFNYAVCLDSGIGADKNEGLALEWYIKAAENGILKAMINAAVSLEAQNRLQDAMHFYLLAANKGNTAAMRKVSEFYRQGIGTEANIELATGYLMTAARSGDGKAQLALAECYRDGVGIGQDYGQMVEMLWLAAGNQEPEAMLEIGQCYSLGRGLKRNPLEAMKWFHAAAKAGSVQAMVELGKNYQAGPDGIPEDPEKGFAWFQQAADQGNTEAMVALGSAYLLGRGTGQNSQKALDILKRAADLGDGRAMYHLGFIAENGMTGPVDLTEASRWYTRSAGRNDADGLAALGRCLLNGTGMDPDPKKARFYLEKAAAAGNRQALDLLKKAEGHN